MDFGKAVLMGIASKRMKRKQVALDLGISINYLYAICNNQKTPSLNLFINMSDLFGINLSELISWGENNERL